MRDDRKDGAERAEPTKALSIQQPWAWLVVNGYKDIENRDWNTKFRGRFYVHAGKKVDGDAYERLRHRFPLPRAADIERGGIVGEATLVGVVDDRLQTSSEWFTGYYGFVLGSPKPLPFRPLRGQLGFFDVPLTAPPGGTKTNG